MTAAPEEWRRWCPRPSTGSTATPPRCWWARPRKTTPSRGAIAAGSARHAWRRLTEAAPPPGRSPSWRSTHRRRRPCGRGSSASSSAVRTSRACWRHPHPIRAPCGSAAASATGWKRSHRRRRPETERVGPRPGGTARSSGGGVGRCSTPRRPSSPAASTWLRGADGASPPSRGGWPGREPTPAMRPWSPTPPTDLAVACAGEPVAGRRRPVPRGARACAAPSLSAEGPRLAAWGVAIRAEGGRLGVALPEEDGVVSDVEQLELALHRAGVRDRSTRSSSRGSAWHCRRGGRRGDASSGHGALGAGAPRAGASGRRDAPVSAGAASGRARGPAGGGCRGDGLRRRPRGLLDELARLDHEPPRRRRARGRGRRAHRRRAVGAGAPTAICVSLMHSRRRFEDTTRNRYATSVRPGLDTVAVEAAGAVRGPARDSARSTTRGRARSWWRSSAPRDELAVERSPGVRYSTQSWVAGDRTERSGSRMAYPADREPSAGPTAMRDLAGTSAPRIADDGLPEYAAYP